MKISTIALLFMLPFYALSAFSSECIFPMRDGYETQLKDNVGNETIKLTEVDGFDNLKCYRMDRICFDSVYQSEFIYANKKGIYVYAKVVLDNIILLGHPYLFLKNELIQGDTWKDTIYAGNQIIPLQFEVFKPEIVSLYDTVIKAIKVVQRSKDCEYERYFAENIGLVKETATFKIDGKMTRTNVKEAILKKASESAAKSPRTISFLTSLIKKDPRNAELYRERALAYHVLNKFNEAVSDLKSFILISDDTVYKQEDLGKMYQTIKNLHETHELYRSYVTNPNYHLPIDSTQLIKIKNRDFAFDSIIVSAILKVNPVQDTIAVEEFARRRGNRIINLTLPEGSVILPSIASCLDSLELIDISETYINYLPLELAKLPKLHNIILLNGVNKGLDAFPANMWKISTLDTIRCVNVPVVEKDFEGISGCHKLKFLMCNETRLEKIPREIFFLQNLSTLELYGNIKSIPASIGKLNNLTSLALGNNIDSIPSEIWFLPKLEVLGLAHNKLEVISPKVQYCSKLKYLNLCHNNLKTLPIEIMSLKTLQSVSIEENLLCDIPDKLGDWLFKNASKTWKHDQRCK